MQNWFPYYLLPFEDELLVFFFQNYSCHFIALRVISNSLTLLMCFSLAKVILRFLHSRSFLLDRRSRLIIEVWCIYLYLYIYVYIYMHNSKFCFILWCVATRLKSLRTYKAAVVWNIWISFCLHQMNTNELIFNCIYMHTYGIYKYILVFESIYGWWITNSIWRLSANVP